MANLTAHVRLRPIRFGFLVQPDDNERLLEVFRVNTCLWGGQFNPVIPHLKTVPPWWDRHGLLVETAAQIGLPVAWNLAGGYQRDAGGGIGPVLEIHRNTMKACLSVYS